MKLFKSKSSTHSAVAVLDNPVPTFTKVEVVPFTVKDIHKDFDEATDRILNEAKAILETPKNTRAEALHELGFHAMTETKEHIEFLDKKRENEQYMTYVLRYLQAYPDNKFITVDEVDRLCKKYNLTCGKVTRYIGDVPDKNLFEIAAFKDVVQKEDIAYMYDNSLAWSWSRGSGQTDDLQDIKKAWHFNHIDKSKVKFSENDNSYTILNEDGTYGHRIYADTILRICAPAKDIDLRRNQVILNNSIVTIVKDPIVLFPVYGKGFIIVSKWGLEAEDELVVGRDENTINRKCD